MASTPAAASGGETPLDVLVKHLHLLPRPTQAVVLCKLLATSAAVGALIQRVCRGKLSLTFATYSQDRLSHSFVPWLSKHGCLLASLTLDLNLTNMHEAETAIGAALQKAAAAAPRAGACGCWQPPQPGLQLQAYCSHPALTGAVLQQLDSWYLTRLELGRHASFSSSFAVEQLTRLCRLTLFEDSADVLMPCVASLPSLTRLALVDVAASSLPKLRHLPTQLMELQVSLARLRRNEQLPPSLALGHLAALTKLSNGDAKPLLVQAGDVLPPSLQVLAVRDVLDVAPLLHLTHLTHITMCASTTPAAQLQLLACSSTPTPSVSSSDSSSSSTGSSHLQAVGLCYGDMEAAAAAAPGWPTLPVDSLELRAAEGTLPGSTVDMLGQLSRLRLLDVCGGCGGFSQAAAFEATQAQLAAALACLTNLEVVGLRGIGLLKEPGAGGGAAAAASQHSSSPPPVAAATPAAAPATASRAAACSEGSAGDGEDTFSAAASRLSLSASSSLGSSSCCSCPCWTACDTKATPPAVAAATASSTDDRNGSDTGCGGSLQVLFAALAGLPRLACVTVCSVTCAGKTLAVDAAAAAALGRASQLTRLQLCDMGLSDAAVNALLAHGLTSLRRLVLDNNPGVTAAVLPDGLVAARLGGLRELSVMRTGIRTDAAGFKARMMRLQPRLLVKSSAR